MGETKWLLWRQRVGESFSILKRIVMGETCKGVCGCGTAVSFSILKRIVMGETYDAGRAYRHRGTFSILKRIVMGETIAGVGVAISVHAFQYPQADRDG